MPSPTLRSLSRFQWQKSVRECPASLRGRIHTTGSLGIKDSLKDRTKINTESTEYSKSGSDAAAAQKDTAFKPGESNPQEEMGSEEKAQGDPLNVSPGNHEISKPSTKDHGAEKSAKDSAGERKSSGGGSPAKGKKVT